MKHLAIAFVIVLFGSSVTFLALSAFGVQQQVAGPISGTLFAAITYVSQVLDKERSGVSLLPAGVVEYSNFVINFYLMVAYVSILILSAEFIASAIAGLVAAEAGVDLGAARPIIFASSLGISLSSAFFLGRWIGKRCSALPFLAIIVSCVIANTIGHGFDYFFLPEERFEQIFHLPRNLASVLLLTVGGSILLSVLGLIGCWRGRARRMAEYLNYLLKRIPNTTRETLVSMAYEEARRLSAAANVRRRAAMGSSL